MAMDVVKGKEDIGKLTGGKGIWMGVWKELERWKAKAVYYITVFQQIASKDIKSVALLKILALRIIQS